MQFDEQCFHLQRPVKRFALNYESLRSQTNPHNCRTYLTKHVRIATVEYICKHERASNSDTFNLYFVVYKN